MVARKRGGRREELLCVQRRSLLSLSLARSPSPRARALSHLPDERRLLLHSRLIARHRVRDGLGQQGINLGGVRQLEAALPAFHCDEAGAGKKEAGGARRQRRGGAPCLCVPKICVCPNLGAGVLGAGFLVSACLSWGANWMCAGLDPFVRGVRGARRRGTGLGERARQQETETKRERERERACGPSPPP